MLSPFLAFVVAGSAAASEPTPESAQAIHQRILVLDTHLDVPTHFGRAGWDIAKRHTFANDLTQVDLPRMVDGGLDGGFFVVFTAQGPLTSAGYADARDHALLRSSIIREVVRAHADQMELATTGADARRIVAAGKRAIFQSVENSYPVGEDLTLVQTFYKLGVRMAGPVHFKNNQLADSSTDKPRWHGMSPLGKRWLKEMNRVGLVIDASHASDEALDQMIAISSTPIVLSHSGTKANFDHPRNIDDQRLKKLATAGGVIQINSLFLVPMNKSPAHEALLDRLDVIDSLSPADQAALVDDFALLGEVDSPGATFDMYMAAVLHALKVAGVEHVGIGADWDGGGGVGGMMDVAGIPAITARLLAEGYTDADVEKIWSGNILRVLDAVDTARDHAPH